MFVKWDWNIRLAFSFPRKSQRQSTGSGTNKYILIMPNTLGLLNSLH